MDSAAVGRDYVYPYDRGSVAANVSDVMNAPAALWLLPYNATDDDGLHYAHIMPADTA